MTLSAPQITRSRAKDQYSVLGLAILQPRTVFACQINGAPGTDQVTSFGFDNVTTGTYSDVLPGQTVFIGSTPGAHDIGICRARKAWTSNTAYIGEESSIGFANDLYVTVVDAFDPRPKHLVVTSTDVFMDVDIDYSDQHENFDPLVTMGGQVVVDVESYPITVNFPDVADSSVFDDTIASYSTAASEGVVTGGTTNNPSVTISAYPANGYVRVATTITSTTGGKSATGYRYIFVFDATHRPVTDFVLDACGADRDSGGWSASVILNDENDFSLVRFGGLAVIFSKDYYDGQEGTIGLYPGRENVWISGWIWEEKSMNDPEFQPRSFDIQSAAFWMSKMASFPVGVEITLSNVAATDWTECAGLTVDKGLFHFLHWRSTLTQIMDVYLTEDTRYSPACESVAGTLWGQMQDMAYSQILAIPTCSHNGKLVIKVPYDLIPSADRASSASHVMDLEGIDFERRVEITRAAPRVAQVFLNGVTVDVNGAGSSLFSLSPGHVPHLIGDLLPVSNLLLATQSQSNTLAGLVFANANNPYDNIPITLSGNNRAFDIAPLLYGTIADLDEYAGVVIPIAIRYSFDHHTGKNSIEIIFEGETSEADAVYTDGDTPGSGDTSTIPSLPAYPDLPDFPIVLPIETSRVESTCPASVVGHDTHGGIVYSTNFDSDNPNWLTMNNGLTPGEYQAVNWIGVCPNGAIYVGRMHSTSGFLARAPALGGTFSVIDLGGEFLVNAAVNPLATEEIGFTTYNGAGVSTFHVGNYASWTDSPGMSGTGTNIPVGHMAAARLRNSWVIFKFSNNYVKFNSTGTSIISSGAVPNSLTSQPVCLPGGTTGIVYSEGGGSKFNKFVDDMASGTLQNNTDDANLSDNSAGIDYRQMDCDPSGRFLMGRANTQPTKWKSSDYGTTWALVTSMIPDGTRHGTTYAGMSDSGVPMWIHSGATVKFSPDNGASWENKTNDLTGIYAFPNINQLKVVGLGAYGST